MKKHHDQKLATGDTGVVFWFAEDPAGIGNNPFPTICYNLRQHSPDAILAGICVQQEGAAKVWKRQDWGHGELLFELLECTLTCHIPCKEDCFLGEVMDGLSYSCEIWHESTVLTNQSQKLTNRLTKVSFGGFQFLIVPVIPVLGVALSGVPRSFC